MKVKNPKPEYVQGREEGVRGRKVELPSIAEVLETMNVKREDCCFEFDESDWLGYLSCLWRIEEVVARKERV